MVKSISITNKDNSLKGLNTPRDGFIQKKKEPKFKQTPTGKIAIINGANNNNQKQPNLPKQQRSPDKNKEQKKIIPQKNAEKQQKHYKEKEQKKVKNPDEDDSDSEEDINEGVTLNDTSMMEESNSDAEESDEDETEKSVLNILGTSLADDTDSDDEDFEEEEEDDDDDDEEEEEEEEGQINKGVKMFRGLKNASDSSMIEEDDADSDEDFEGEEEEDDADEDEVEESEKEADEDEDEESEEEADESKLGLKALLGNSIADDDDDEDFVGTEEGEDDDDDNISDEEEEEDDEDEDMEDEKPKKNGTNKSSKQKKNDQGNVDDSLEAIKTDKRTIFVGNLPKDATKKQIRKLFKKFGDIDTIRLRGIVGKSPNMPKKIAAKTNKVHPQLKSVYAYVKFDSEQSVKSAVSMNGQLLEGNYLRVDAVYKSKKEFNAKKGVFLGNLSFNLDDNSVRKHFESCGEIESVRIIRDNKTGIGKGFGYVNFKTEDAATLAMELNGTTIGNRKVRVQLCSAEKKKHSKRSLPAGGGPKNPTKKLKNNEEKAVTSPQKENTTKKGKKKQQNSGGKQTSPQQVKTFQGQKADLNKKKKQHKLDKKKKQLAEKLLAKTKKPTN